MFCPKCGKALEDWVSFCPECGSKIKKKTDASSSNASLNNETFKSEPEIKNQTVTSNKTVSVSNMTGKTAEMLANKGRGEVITRLNDIVSGDALPTVGEYTIGEIGGIVGITSQVISGAKNAVNTAKTVGNTAKEVKEKKKTGVKPVIAILFSLIMVVVWVAQLIMMQKGIDNTATRILSYVTYATGGLGRGTAGFAGGILGRGVVCSALCSVLCGGLGTIFYGIKNLFASGKQYKSQGLKGSFILFIIGVVLSAILYLFFAGNLELMGTITAIAGIITALRSVGSKSGILYGIMSLFARKKVYDKKVINHNALRSFMAGLIAGYALILAFITVLPKLDFVDTDSIKETIYETLGIELDSEDDEDENNEKKKDKDKDKEKDKDKDDKDDEDKDEDDDIFASGDSSYDEVPSSVVENVNTSADPADYFGSYTGTITFEIYGLDYFASMSGMDSDTIEKLNSVNGNTYTASASYEDNYLTVTSDDMPAEIGQMLSMKFGIYDDVTDGIYIDAEGGDEDGITFSMVSEVCFLQEGQLYCLNGATAKEGNELKFGMSIRIILTQE